MRRFLVKLGYWMIDTGEALVDRYHVPNGNAEEIYALYMQDGADLLPQYGALTGRLTPPEK